MLGAFLKSLRGRINCEARALGPHERLPSRRGKRVTQEEIAEAISVSRVWYATLESDAPIRASMGVLRRIADVLMLSSDERVRLFQLAIPDLQRVELGGDSTPLFEALPFMRVAAKRLWAATSESEVLGEASEQLATWFRDVAQIASARRRDIGIWDTRLLRVADRTKRFENVIRELGPFAIAEDVDDAFVFPQLLQPGDAGLVRGLYSSPVRKVIDDSLARFDLRSFDCLSARVRSRSGTIAGLGLFQEVEHVFSATDRAILSTVAELTSLALS